MIDNFNSLGLSLVWLYEMIQILDRIHIVVYLICDKVKEKLYCKSAFKPHWMTKTNHWTKTKMNTWKNMENKIQLNLKNDENANGEMKSWEVFLQLFLLHSCFIFNIYSSIFSVVFTERHMTNLIQKLWRWLFEHFCFAV